MGKHSGRALRTSHLLIALVSVGVSKHMDWRTSPLTFAQRLPRQQATRERLPKLYATVRPACLEELCRPEQQLRVRGLLEAECLDKESW